MKIFTRPATRFVRDFVFALVVLAGLYAFAFSPVWPLQLPGYLLVGGFDRLEIAFGTALGLGVTYETAFALYLLALAALGAVVAAAVRARLGSDSRTDGVAGVLVFLGLFVLSLVVTALAQGGISLVPVLTITATGLALCGFGWATALFARNYRLNLVVPRDERPE